MFFRNIFFVAIIASSIVASVQARENRVQAKVADSSVVTKRVSFKNGKAVVTPLRRGGSRGGYRGGYGYPRYYGPGFMYPYPWVAPVVVGPVVTTRPDVVIVKEKQAPERVHEIIHEASIFEVRVWEGVEGQKNLAVSMLPNSLSQNERRKRLQEAVEDVLEPLSSDEVSAMAENIYGFDSSDLSRAEIARKIVAQDKRMRDLIHQKRSKRAHHDSNHG